jgi:hypothetical protein
MGITEEILLVDMRIWCIKIGIVLVWHYLQFYIPFKNFSLIWRRHHCRWRAAKFRPKLCAQGLWAGRDLYRVTPAVTQGLGFCGLIGRTRAFSYLLRRTRECEGPILTQILTRRFYSNCTFQMKY